MYFPLGVLTYAAIAKAMPNIINKDVGLVFKMDDEKMLAEKIKLILDKKVVFDKEWISDYAKSKYSQDIFMDKLLMLYEEIRGK